MDLVTFILLQILSMIPMISVIIGCSLLIFGVHEEAWGDVIIRPLYVWLGLFFIALPIAVGIAIYIW
jgi:hypothetical protein